MFEANVWGMMFYGKKIADSHGPTQTYGIHLYEFVGTMLSCIRHADTMLQALGYSGPIHIRASLKSLCEAPWLYSESYGGIFDKKMESQLDDEVEFSISTTTDNLRNEPDGVAMEILRYVFYSVNWLDLIDTQSKQEDLLRKGYYYNGWSSRKNWQD
jgi:hypothetical protein